MGYAREAIERRYNDEIWMPELRVNTSVAEKKGKIKPFIKPFSERERERERERESPNNL